MVHTACFVASRCQFKPSTKFSRLGRPFLRSSLRRETLLQDFALPRNFALIIWHVHGVWNPQKHFFVEPYTRSHFWRAPGIRKVAFSWFSASVRCEVFNVVDYSSTYLWYKTRLKWKSLKCVIKITFFHIKKHDEGRGFQPDFLIKFADQSSQVKFLSIWFAWYLSIRLRVTKSSPVYADYRNRC